MRSCTPFNVIKRVKSPSSFHVTFVLVNKFVCDTHLFSTRIIDHVLVTLEGVKRVLFYTISSELDEKVVFFEFRVEFRASVVGLLLIVSVEVLTHGTTNLL